LVRRQVDVEVKRKKKNKKKYHGSAPYSFQLQFLKPALLEVGQQDQVALLRCIKERLDQERVMLVLFGELVLVNGEGQQGC